MSTIDLSTRTKSVFSFTELSTLRLLACVGLTCAALWAVIATTVGA